jgi:hypothetical protein
MRTPWTLVASLVAAAGVLGLAPAARAQLGPSELPPYEPLPPGETIDVFDLPPGEAAPDLGLFDRTLAPYGRWVHDARWGRLWTPHDLRYRPYDRGYWQLTSWGMTWVAEEPFGWIVTHYGRWFWSGRWYWRPDNVWGPAWVMWREADGYLGWAPMPPLRVVIAESHWRFVPSYDVLRVDLRGAHVRDGWSVYRRSRPVVRYVRTPRGELYVAGPDLVRHRVTVRPAPLLPRVHGRYLEGEWRDRRAGEQRRRQELGELRRQRTEQRRSHADARQQRERTIIPPAPRREQPRPNVHR